MLHKTRMHGFDEDFDVFVSRVQALASRLRNSDESVSEGELIYVVLEGLTEEYKALKASLEVQDNLGLEAICAHVRAAQEKLRYAEQAEAERAASQETVFAAREHDRRAASKRDVRANCRTTRPWRRTTTRRSSTTSAKTDGGRTEPTRTEHTRTEHRLEVTGALRGEARANRCWHRWSEWLVGWNKKSAWQGGRHRRKEQQGDDESKLAHRLTLLARGG